MFSIENRDGDGKEKYSNCQLCTIFTQAREDIVKGKEGYDFDLLNFTERYNATPYRATKSFLIDSNNKILNDSDTLS